MNQSLPPIPIDTGIVHAVAALVDDAGATRQPSHSEIEDAIRAAGALTGDPHQKGSSVGKQKRVRATLRAAADADDRAAQRLVREVIDLVWTLGGFREESPDYCSTLMTTEAWRPTPQTSKSGTTVVSECSTAERPTGCVTGRG